MRNTIMVNFGNLVLSLSDAMDLSNSLLHQHQQRTAFMVWKMGEAGGIQKEFLEQCFIAALLHDIGALSLEEKINLRNYELDDVERHCIIGNILLEKIPWFGNAGKLIRYHHKEWQKWDQTIENDIVFGSQLISLADFIERQITPEPDILNQRYNIINNLKNISGTQFHPQLVELFTDISEIEEFWLDLVSPRLYSILLNNGPFRDIQIDFENITLISELFRNIIDFKSRFTSTHSSGVAACASILSKIFGLTEKETELMYVAGNIHDLGKLAVPNSILEKPGKLSAYEFNIMKSHTYHSYSIISTITGLKDIAEWAAFHHEKLDGSGYPFHCKEYELSTNSRIMMVADIFTALAENRPYRKAMSREEITDILNNFSERKLLDSNITDLVLNNYNEIHSYVLDKQENAREHYEKQFST
jgi:HD-GYP domain-containing protein (c-di-GMP phosphodiesterase class II)